MYITTYLLMAIIMPASTRERKKELPVDLIRPDYAEIAKVGFNNGRQGRATLRKEIRHACF